MHLSQSLPIFSNSSNSCFLNYHSSVLLTDDWTRDKMLTTHGPPLMFTCCVTFHICRKNTMDDRTFLQENWGCLHSLTTFPLLLHLHLKKTEIIVRFVTFLIKEIVQIRNNEKYYLEHSAIARQCYGKSARCTILHALASHVPFLHSPIFPSRALLPN